jgi:hypothetical protein
VIRYLSLAEHLWLAERVTGIAEDRSLASGCGFPERRRAAVSALVVGVSSQP